MRWTPWALTGFVLMAAFLIPGCGASEVGGRMKVSGKVMYKGQLVKEGSIEFQPMSGGTTISGSPIENGDYYIPADKGLAPGMYTVRIFWIDTGGPRKDEPGGLPGPDHKELIPAQYNTKSTLTREVKKGVDNVIDFDLK